ncbi:hypothetical protein ALC62_07355, partial [Cyphomyrmex costatus]
EETFWWNHLEENTFPSHSMIHAENETDTQLSGGNSRINSSQDSTAWWKNLDSSNKATTSTRRSAAIVKNNILQTSTSESEKELISRKRKIHLKANSKKSINNAFENALNDTEVTVPLKFRMKQVDHESHSDSDSKSSQEKSQENEEDSNLNSTEKIFKSKSSTFRPRRGGSMEDQNAFQDILTKDVLSSSTVEKTIVFEKESSKRSMDQNINVSKDHIDDHRKPIEVPQTKPLENIETDDSLTLHVEEEVPETNADSNQSSNGSIVVHRQRLKLKSRFKQKARKSIEKNAFADALADSNSNLMLTSNSNKENNNDKSSMSRSSLSPLKRLVNLKTAKVNINVMPESSPVRKSPRLSLNISKEQQSNLSVQAKNNTKTSSSSSSSDSDESHGPKRSIFFKSKSKILGKFRKRSTNPFEEISNISDRRSNVSIKSNRASFKRESAIRINQERGYLAIEKDSQSVKDKTMNEENSLQLSKSSSSKKDDLTHNSSRNQSETLKSMNKTIEVSKRSMNLIADSEVDNNVETSETSKDGPLHIITTEEIHSKDNTNTGTQKSTSLSTEMEMTDGEDAESAKQTNEQNSLTKPGTSKTVNQQSVQSPSRTNIKNNREIAHRQKSLDKSQNHDSIPTKSSSKDISSNKQTPSKSVRKIHDFFKVKETAMEQLSGRAQKSLVLNEKMKNLKIELEKIKSRKTIAMKMNPTDEKQSAVKPKRVKLITPKRDTKKKLKNSTTVVDKAFLVNGKVYRPPRLPRPKHWVTDRLYKFLWKRMEPKYKLSTRVKSEKFVQELVKIVATIERCKNYEDYKTELEAVMKEMARLEIIVNRMDFYHFCQDFLPYEFRVKAIPMLLPGNKINIPYNPENVYIPLLDTNEQSLEI